jgi:hypothetical protein
LRVGLNFLSRGSEAARIQNKERENRVLLYSRRASNVIEFSQFLKKIVLLI